MFGSKLNLVFMGTPDFAVPALQSLIGSSHRLRCVYTRAPRPAGRGQKERRSPVHELALAHGIEVRTPSSLREAAEQQAFAALRADAAVVVAYGLILPAAILNAPRMGCFNIHASLLPRWRGAAPIERAIMAGDPVSGVSIMRMEEGLDTGPVVLKRTLPIGATMTAGALHDRLALIGAAALLEALDGIVSGELPETPQDEKDATYAKKLVAGEERLDWRKPAAELERLVRAFSPRPGTWFSFKGERIRVLAASLVHDPVHDSRNASPGTVLDNLLTVACGQGALRLLTLQRAGRAAMPAETFLRGFPLPRHTPLSSPGDPSDSLPSGRD